MHLDQRQFEWWAQTATSQAFGEQHRKELMALLNDARAMAELRRQAKALRDYLVPYPASPDRVELMVQYQKRLDKILDTLLKYVLIPQDREAMERVIHRLENE